MLTKEQIDKIANDLFNHDYSPDIWNALRLMCDQAEQAIDLTAKLSAIKALCEESRKSGRRLSYLDVLEIIKEDT